MQRVRLKTLAMIKKFPRKSSETVQPVWKWRKKCENHKSFWFSKKKNCWKFSPVFQRTNSSFAFWISSDVWLVLMVLRSETLQIKWRFGSIDSSNMVLLLVTLKREWCYSFVRFSKESDSKLRKSFFDGKEQKMDLINNWLNNAVNIILSLWS